LNKTTKLLHITIYSFCLAYDRKIE